MANYEQMIQGGTDTTGLTWEEIMAQDLQLPVGLHNISVLDMNRDDRAITFEVETEKGLKFALRQTKSFDARDKLSELCIETGVKALDDLKAEKDANGKIIKPNKAKSKTAIYVYLDRNGYKKWAVTEAEIKALQRLR